ncbi:MAG: hypothetical protein ACLFPF_01300 [Halanaerobiales bacterium]
MKTKIILVFLLVFISPLSITQGMESEITLYFFWGEGCLHCEEVKGDIQKWEQTYPNLIVKSYEVFDNEENKDFFEEKAAELGSNARGVPAYIFGDNIWFGTSKIDEIKDRLESVFNSEIAISQTINNNTIELPLLGQVNLENTSIVVTTLLIAVTDGFNPCSLWVLTFLLNFIIYSGSRKRVLLVGLTFLTVSAITYGVFISGVFTVFSYIQDLFYIRLFMFVFIIIFALVNIKDYFCYKKGFSFSVPEKYKPGVLKNLGKLSRAEGSSIKIIALTAISSISITLLELPCTAGFPFLWMNIIQKANISNNMFIVLLAMYLLVYFLDELLIVFTVYITLRIKKLNEDQGRQLKLISGIIMFYLAIGLFVMPDFLENLSGVVYVILLTTATYLLIKFFSMKRNNKCRY